LACLVIDDPRRVVLGGEPVRSGDTVCGRVTSGGYGYTVDASIAYAYLPIAQAEPGTVLEVDLFGEWLRATVVAQPLFDPTSSRVRG
jgi:4-methylaminobutanoate oxidase (formaldehyde-forming)